MQAENINKYLQSDEIFNKINREFIAMNPDDIEYNNQLLNPIFNKLLDAMRQQSPLFAKTFQRIMWAGSFYKGTRVGQPEEYDLNFVINLPIKKKELISNRPGYIKIHTDWKDKHLHYTSILDCKVYKELNSLIDEQSYLNQEKFRNWMERILGKVANDTSGNNKIILDGYAPIRIRKSGPAFTLIFQLPRSGEIIDIDVVPVLVFSTRILPPNCSRRDPLQPDSNRYWSAVPKPINNKKGFDFPHRYWRLCFYEFEKNMLSSHEYGRMKPVIRQLKKFRDTQRLNSVASYYIETLCYHESEMFHISQRKSLTFLFFTMLEKLRNAFNCGSIRYYWDDYCNLLENIGFYEMRNMEGKLNNVLKEITKNIKDDRYAIARYVLNRQELDILINLECRATTEPELEPEPEVSNQWSCVIV